MSTYITVTSGTGALVNRVKQVQQANRKAQLQRESDAALQAQVTEDATAQAAQTERPIGGSPDTSIERRPAAQRELGSVMAVEYTSQLISGTPSATFRLRVGPPGLLEEAQADVLEPSTAAASSLPPSTDTDSGSGEALLGFLTTGANGYSTQYPCGYTFQIGTGTPPLTSWTEFTVARVVTQNFNDSHAYLLPIGDKSGIFVYVYSKLRLLTVYERYSRTDRVSVNERITSSGCGLQPGTYYDRESTFQVTDTLDNIEERQRYEVLAFYVNETSVRQLTVPAELDAAMRALHPPMGVNSTTQQLTSSVYTRYEYADVAGVTNEPQNYNGPVTYGYSTIPAFSDVVHRQQSLHGDYPSGHDTLARQFGLGALNTDSHGGDYYSPAVFRFIAAAMDLSSAATQTYAYMRGTFFGRAPSKYLAPCVVDGSCPLDEYDEPTTVVFDTTTTAPVDINTPVATGSFRRGSKYKVELNGSAQYAVTYGWDWDNPNYCRQQLTQLGFTGADLKP